MRRILLSLVLLFGLATNGLHTSSTAATSTRVNISDAENVSGSTFCRVAHEGR
jgi:hypothetical protein